MTTRSGGDRETVSDCRGCGCRDIRVAWTYRAADGSIRRRRVCRHCGEGFTTIERDIRDIAETRPPAPGGAGGGRFRDQ